MQEDCTKFRRGAGECNKCGGRGQTRVVLLYTLALFASYLCRAPAGLESTF